MNLRVITTKKHERMAIFDLDDEFGTMSCVIFPKNWRHLQDIVMSLEEAQPVTFTGKISIDSRKKSEDEDSPVAYQMIVSNVETVTLNKRSIYIKYEHQDEYDKIIEIAKKYPGMDKIYVVCFHDGCFDAVEKVPMDIDLGKVKRVLRNYDFDSISQSKPALR